PPLTADRPDEEVERHRRSVVLREDQHVALGALAEMRIAERQDLVAGCRHGRTSSVVALLSQIRAAGQLPLRPRRPPGRRRAPEGPEPAPAAAFVATPFSRRRFRLNLAATRTRGGSPWPTSSTTGRKSRGAASSSASPSRR